MPSFLDELALVDFNNDIRAGVLEDLKTIVKFIEVKPFANELETKASRLQKFNAIVGLLDSIPKHERHLFHIQVYFSKEYNLDGWKERIKEYIDPDLLESDLTQDYLKMMNEHIDLMCNDDGVFKDKYSGANFSGHTVRCRLVIYRKYPHYDVAEYARDEAIKEANLAADLVVAELRNIGCVATIMNEDMLYRWWVNLFNPNPQKTNGSTSELLKSYPLNPERPAHEMDAVPEIDENPENFRFNLIDRVFHEAPYVSDSGEGVCFDGVEHRCIFLGELKMQPRYGELTSDGVMLGNKFGSLFDKLPVGSIYTLQLCFPDVDSVRDHLGMIEKRAIGKGGEPIKVKQRAITAYDAVAKNNPAMWCTQAIIYNDLKDNIDSTKQQVQQILKECKHIMEPYPDGFRKFPVDDFIRLLPCNWDFEFAKQRMFVANLHFATEVAALLPFYGRSNGAMTDSKKGIQPRFNFFTGSGEPFSFDMYSEKFKLSNFHAAIFGSSGSGKSVIGNYIATALLSSMKCRVVLFEQGGSFDLLTLYMRQMGKKVQYLKFDPSIEVPFNPYVDAYLMLDQIKKEKARLRKEKEATLAGKEHGINDEMLIKEIHEEAMGRLYDLLNNTDKVKAERQDSQDIDRDLITEYVTITKTFIVGDSQDEKISTHETGLIMDVLEYTFEKCQQEGVLQVMPHHVMNGFVEYARDSGKVTDKEDRKRLEEFHQSMKSVITGKLSGYFNKPTHVESDFDYYHIDLGFLATKGNEANLNIVSISVLSRILSLCQASAADGIPTIFFIDEAHILFKYQLLAQFLILMAKISRKINLNLLPMTQNLSDMSGGDVQKMLSMMDTLICLYMDNKERKLFEENKALSDGVMAMLNRARKNKPFYSEAVLVHENYQGIFKNIPPRKMLALAMTDPNEKELRKELSDANGYTTLEAVEAIANELKTMKVVKESQDEMFI